jgi:hypothetical protein
MDARLKKKSSKKLDLEKHISGAESEEEWVEDCPHGLDVRLWTIKDGSHTPTFSPGFVDLSWQWLWTHSKP